MKITKFYPEYMSMLPKGKNEFKLEATDFIGYIDLVSENEEGTYDIWDFKYSNNIKTYKESMQLHIYKYCFELLTGKKVRSINYLFVPKTKLKRDFEQSVLDFRDELRRELAKMKPVLVEIPYDDNKVDEFFELIDEIESPDTKLKKNVSYLCHWCDYEDICIRGRLKD